VNAKEKKKEEGGTRRRHWEGEEKLRPLVARQRRGKKGLLAITNLAKGEGKRHTL